MWSREIDKSPLIRNIYTQLAQSDSVPESVKVHRNFFGLGARTVKLKSKYTEIKIDDLVKNLQKDLNACTNLSNEDKEKYKNIVYNLQKINDQKTGFLSDLFDFRKNLLAKIASDILEGNVSASGLVPSNDYETKRKHTFESFEKLKPITIENEDQKKALFEKYMNSSNYDFIWRVDNKILIFTELSHKDDSNKKIQVLLMVIGNPLGDPEKLSYQIGPLHDDDRSNIIIQ